MAGNIARQRLIQKEKDAEELYNRNIDNMVLEISKTSALSAINVNQLLKKKWLEEKNAYKVMSNVKTEKDMRRLAKLMKEDQF